MSAPFRAPRSVAHARLALIGVISTTLLVGASAMPSGAARPASGLIVADGPTRPVPVQPQGTTQASTGSPAQFRLKEERDRLVLRFTDQLVYLESVSANATPGSPAQFRAHEEAESLGERLRSIARD